MYVFQDVSKSGYQQSYQPLDIKGKPVPYQVIKWGASSRWFWSKFRIAQYRDGDHQKDAPHFIFVYPKFYFIRTSILNNFIV